MKITNIKLNKNGKYVVTIDNEKFLVDDVTEEMGLFVIKLGRLSNNRGVI